MKKRSIYFKRIFEVVVILVALFFINSILKYLLIDDSTSYTRVMLHELYKQDNIDVLFLGSSHSYRSIDPNILDSISNKNTFNAGTSSQTLEDSYALLVEAGKTNKIEEVYLELTYLVMYDTNNSIAKFILSDYMKPSISKYQYLFRKTPKEQLANGLLLGRRNWKKLSDIDYIKNNIKNKSKSSYRNYEPVTYDNEYYAEKGFVYSLDKIEQNSFLNQNDYSEIDIEQVMEITKQIQKIIDYCERHNIKLVCYSAPMPDFRLYATPNYDEYHNKLTLFLKSSNVEYYDFNLCRKEYLSLSDDCYKDDNHLNGKGSQIFSNCIGEFFYGSLQEKEIFYQSYKDRVKGLEPRFLGIIYQEDTNEGVIFYSIKPVTLEQKDYLYTIYTRKENSNIKNYIVSLKNVETFYVNDLNSERVFIEVYDSNGTDKIAEMHFYINQ